MKQIRDAVITVKDILRCTQDMGHEEDRDAIKALLDLAEKFLADGVGLSEEQMCDIIFKERINGDWTRESVAKAIHKAQMEKLGGVR